MSDLQAGLDLSHQGANLLDLSSPYVQARANTIER